MIMTSSAYNCVLILSSNSIKPSSLCSIISTWRSIFLICSINRWNLSYLSTWVSMKLTWLLERFSNCLVLLILRGYRWMIKEISTIINVYSSYWRTLTLSRFWGWINCKVVFHFNNDLFLLTCYFSNYYIYF